MTAYFLAPPIPKRLATVSCWPHWHTFRCCHFCCRHSAITAFGLGFSFLWPFAGFVCLRGTPESSLRARSSAAVITESARFHLPQVLDVQEYACAPAAARKPTPSAISTPSVWWVGRKARDEGQAEVESNRHRYRACGSSERIRAYAENAGQRWLKTFPARPPR